MEHIVFVRIVVVFHNRGPRGNAGQVLDIRNPCTHIFCSNSSTCSASTVPHLPFSSSKIFVHHGRHASNDSTESTGAAARADRVRPAPARPRRTLSAPTTSWPPGPFGLQTAINHLPPLRWRAAVVAVASRSFSPGATPRRLAITRNTSVTWTTTVL